MEAPSSTTKQFRFRVILNQIYKFFANSNNAGKENQNCQDRMYIKA